MNNEPAPNQTPEKPLSAGDDAMQVELMGVPAAPVEAPTTAAELASAAAPTNQTMAQVAVAAAQQAAAVAEPDASQQVSVGDSPMGPLPSSAQDADKIEPEWVDAVENAIRATEGDPHAEEEAFEAIQVDYMNKRFGMHIKKSTSE